MGEEITNGVSDVLKELYGVLELMTVYMLCLGILAWCWLSLWWCWTSGHGGWGINEKWIKAESSEDGIYIHFLDEEKIQVSDSVTAVHLTMFVVWTLPYRWLFIDVIDDKTQGKIDLRNESGRPMKVKVVGEVSEKWN